MLTMTACRTTKQEDTKIVLPPKPQRHELPPVESVKDMANTIVYYEALVQQWELWGYTVEGLVYGEQRTDN